MATERDRLQSQTERLECEKSTVRGVSRNVACANEQRHFIKAPLHVGLCIASIH